jgi:uncharacterized SAM-binding protein YcdF (DUF218 family)
LFILSKILWWIAKPSVLLILLMVIGTALTLWRPRHRLGRWFLGVGAFSLFAIAVLPLDSWLLTPLEERFPAIHEMPKHVDGIIVLGGAVDPDLTVLHGMPSLNDAAERFTAFAMLARLYPDAKLIFTGGSPSILPGAPPEAEAAKALLGELGLDTSRIVFEDRSRNTFENAVDSKGLMKPQPGEVWVLVTSAQHMPRSVGIFRRVGWPVLPWPVGYKAGDESPFSSPGLRFQRLDGGVHEWIGLVAYRLLDRTDSLFPEP